MTAITVVTVRSAAADCRAAALARAADLPAEARPARPLVNTTLSLPQRIRSESIGSALSAQPDACVYCRSDFAASDASSERLSMGEQSRCQPTCPILAQTAVGSRSETAQNAGLLGE
jgi:hypothetical protein